MNLEKLSPAPWKYEPCLLGSPSNRLNPVVDSIEAPIARIFSQASTLAGMTSRAPCREEAETNAEFIALARNAFDVMMRRGWVPHKELDGWTVRTFSLPVYSKCSPDPFTALVDADQWYSLNVDIREKQP